MKRSISNTLKFMYFFVCATVMFSQTALAYLDPNTTSYIIQAIAAVFIACGAFIGIFWKKIRMHFRKKKYARLEKKLAKRSDSAEKAASEEKQD